MFAAFAVNLVERNRVQKEQSGQQLVEIVQVPHSVKSIEFYRPVPAQLWVHVKTFNNGSEDNPILFGNLTAIDPQTEQVVCEVKEVRFTPLSQSDER